jgi:hypothetical protein
LEEQMRQSRSFLRILAVPVVLVVLVALAHAASASTAAPRWRVVPSPNPSDQANYLSSVATLGSGDAWAVGAWYRPQSTPGTLTTHWDGASWAMVQSPNATQGYNELYGVDAVSSNDVWAVGYANIANYGSEKTLVEHWNGAAWAIVPSQNIGPDANFLYGVSAISANDVWAVGEGNSHDISSGVTMAQHWNGTSWTVVTTPNVGTEANALYAVEAIAADDVWAFGEAEDHGAIAMHYDGATWSLVPTPSPADAALESAVALAPNDVWAVGYAQSKTLVEHWNGTAWTVVPSPNGSKPNSVLSGVADAGGGRLWAVGTTYDDLTVTAKTITARWDGTAWALVPSPNPGSGYSDLEDVADGPGGAWAVGGTTSKTIIMHART